LEKKSAKIRPAVGLLKKAIIAALSFCALVREIAEF